MSTRGPQHRVLASILLLISVGVVVILLVISAEASATSRAATYPRKQTLVTSGTQWGSIRGFNPYFGNYAVGTVGLCYETLLRYDPLKSRYISWLAESAKFSGKKEYTVKVRSGIRWSNGQKFTGKDVRFNFRLGRFSTASWHDLFSSLKSIRVKGRTVVFTFKRTPNYASWQNLIWNLPMVNPKQARSIKSAASFEAFGRIAGERYPAPPVGTGPYELDAAGFDPTTRVAWKKKAAWWAAKQKLALSPAPKYIVDVAGIEGNLLSMIPSAVTDLENYYLPGVQSLVAKKQVRTYYPGFPYNLSTNTVWLTPNTTHKPLNDPAFRKALASSININDIVKNVYGNLVQKANATGLLPPWKKWVDQKQLKGLGFKYSTAKAKSLLAAAGYKDTNGDGYVETKDGSPIDLSIAVPQGHFDWEVARDMIVASAKDAGIRLHRGYTSDYKRSAFDLVIDSTPQISDNPWTYFDFLFHEPILANQTSVNFSRYKNKAAWNLVQKLGRTPLDMTAARKSIMKRLEKITLTELPNIPLWYNGLWSQTESRSEHQYWTNWPSSTSKRNYVPSMWRGYIQMTGIDMITHLKPA